LSISLVLASLLFSTSEAGAVGCDIAADAAGLVINELLVDPEGIDPGLQWIEVYNETGLDLSVSGWRIEAGTAGVYDTSSTLGSGTYFIDGEHVVIAQTALPFADIVRVGFVAGAAETDADAVRLVDCVGDVVDTVVYGMSNPDGWVQDDGDVAVSLAPAPRSGQTLARMPDGADTGLSGADFELVTTPTPGSSNHLPPLHCGGPGSGLLLNEVFDEGVVWFELLHTGDAPALLEGWSIAFGGTSMVPAYTFAAGQVASPGARFVVGDAPEAAYPADLDLTGITAIRIVDCLGFGSDTVVGGLSNTMGWVDDDGTFATGLAPVVPPGQSLSRSPDGTDTNDTSVDFAPLDPSPAVENGLTEPPPEDTDTPPPPEDTDDTDAPAPPPDDTPPDVSEEPPGNCGCATGAGGAPSVLPLVALLLRGRRSTRRS
jgi:hypothetical protein